MGRFYVTAVLHYTVERPDASTAENEAESVRSNTMIEQYPLDEVEIPYLERAESEGGEGYQRRAAPDSHASEAVTTIHRRPRGL